MRTFLPRLEPRANKARMATRAFPIILALALSVKAVMIAALLGQGAIDVAQLAARYTARVAFPLFLIPYCASSLLRLWPRDLTKALVRYRRQWGLGFAFTHSVHLGALTGFYVLKGITPSTQTLLGGGLAYGFIYVMALTSNDASMNALGKWWKRIHVAGMHWIWFVFALTYFGRLFDAERWVQGAVFFPLCLVALGLRLAVALRRKRLVPG
jgi:methionine sulfoxide reductase heme-binding subunit